MGHPNAFRHDSDQLPYGGKFYWLCIIAGKIGNIPMRTFIGAVVGVLGLAASAAAQSPVAIVEDVQGKVDGVEFMDYVAPGKVIKLGPEHPRIYRDMHEHPVILGHEVCMTVVGVGADLAGQYRTGDRFIVQADIFVDGVGYAYGYEIQGGLSQYNVIDRRVLQQQSREIAELADRFQACAGHLRDAQLQVFEFLQGCE